MQTKTHDLAVIIIVKKTTTVESLWTAVYIYAWLGTLVALPFVYRLEVTEQTLGGIPLHRLWDCCTVEDQLLNVHACS